MSYTNNFDGLVQFKTDIIEPLTRGASLDAVTFPPGYRDLYEQWTEVVGDALIKMNPDDRLSSFTDYIREENKRFADKVIKRMVTSGAKKKLWRQAAARGQVLRVSKDGVKFDSLIRSDQLMKNDGDTTFVLSDTCRSTTNDLQEVCDEQSGLSISAKLREQHFLVQNTERKGRVYKIEVVHPKTGVYSVNIDLDKPFTEILSFVFKNGQGESKVVDMNEVGEAYERLGESMLTQGDAMRMAAELAIKGTASALNAKSMAKGAFNQSAAAALTAALVNSNRKNEPGVIPETVMPNGMVVPNVQAAKANVDARIAMATIGVQDAKKQEEESRVGENESRYAARQYKDEQAEKRKAIQAKNKVTQGHIAKATGLVGVGTGLVSAALGALIV